MILALAVAVGGLIVLAAILGIRWLDARTWRRSLVAYRLRLPANLDTGAVARWLRMVAATTHGPRWSLFPLPPLGMELVATAQEITHYLLIPRGNEQRFLATVRAGLPGARLESAPGFLVSCPRFEVAGEFTMTNRQRLLSIQNAEATSHALLAALRPLGSEEVRVQWAMTSAGTPAPVHSASPRNGDRWWASYLLEGDVAADAEAARAARLKQQDHLLQVVMRVGVSAPNKGRAYKLFGAAWSAVHGLNAPGVRLVRRWASSRTVADRMARRALPLSVYPLLLNASELVGLLGLPLGRTSLPGLSLTVARQLAPSPAIPTRGLVLADSNYPGAGQPLALRLDDRLRHTYVLGPTGVGKSTLLANMALQDMVHGAGLALIDPKSDLVADVLARVPDERRDDVVVVDPAATDRPVGFNLLGGLHSEAERELAVDHVVHIMASLWKESWGPRSHDLVRNALLTLTYTQAPDGSAFTLVEVPELLTNKTFRRFVTSQRTVPAVVRPFWFAYEQMSDAERANVIAAPMNKLRALTTRSSLRLMLGQSNGIDVADVFRKRQVLLAPLSKGVVGTETAQLISALLTSSLFQAAFRRAAIPREHRRPAFIYLDEVQDSLRLPLDIADALAQLRGLGVGLVAANQHLGQLPDTIKEAVLGTARTSVVFQLDYEDAKVMERRYAPLTADDLMGLPAYEVAIRPSVHGQTHPPVTGTTRPLSTAAGDASELAKRSRERYGKPRSEVEAAIQARITPPGTTRATGEYGRRKREEP